MILADTISNGYDNQQQAREVKHADAYPQGGAAPVSGDPPQGPVPEPLGQKQNRHDGQPNQYTQ